MLRSGPFLLFSVLAIGLAGCAPTLAHVRDEAWAAHGALGDTVRFELPRASQAGRVDADGRPFDAVLNGYPAHVDGASYDEPGGSVADSGVVLLVVAVQFASATCPAIDAAFLDGERTSLATLPGATVLSFEPSTAGGLPGYVVEMSYGDFWSGKGRVLTHVAFGERSVYLLMTGFADMPIDQEPGHAIHERLVKSFAPKDHAPAAGPTQIPGQVIAEALAKLHPRRG